MLAQKKVAKKNLKVEVEEKKERETNFTIEKKQMLEELLPSVPLEEEKAEARRRRIESPLVEDVMVMQAEFDAIPSAPLSSDTLWESNDAQHETSRNEDNDVDTSPTKSLSISREKHTENLDHESLDDNSLASSVKSPLQPSRSMEESPTEGNVEESSSSCKSNDATAPALPQVKSPEHTSQKVRDELLRSLPTKEGLYPAHVPSPTAIAPSAPAEDTRNIHRTLPTYENYEKNTLRDDEREFKQHRRELVQRPSVFYEAVESYIYAEHNVRAVNARISSLKASVKKSIASDVWSINTDTISKSVRCGDGKNITEKVSFQIAEFHPDTQQVIEADLNELRHLRTAITTMCIYDRETSIMNVDDYLDRLLMDGEGSSYFSNACNAEPRSQVAHASSSFFQRREPNLQAQVDHLRHCINVLFFFEREVVSNEARVFGKPPISRLAAAACIVSQPNGKDVIECHSCHGIISVTRGKVLAVICTRCGASTMIQPAAISIDSQNWLSSVECFRKALRKWIERCVSVLLAVASFQDMSFVLRHLMRLPGVSESRSWALGFLELPSVVINPDGTRSRDWTDALVDHYLALVSILLTPDETDDGSCLHVMIQASDDSPRPTTTSTNKEPWLVVQDPVKASKVFLSDEDFVALWNQLPNSFACEQILAKNTTATNESAVKGYARMLNFVSHLCRSLQTFEEYAEFHGEIARTIVKAVRVTSEHHIRLFESCCDTESLSFLDQICLVALEGLLAYKGNESFLSQLPYEHLSCMAAWEAFLQLYFSVNKTFELQRFANDIREFQSYKTPESWFRCCETSSTLRKSFRTRLSQQSPVMRQQKMEALATLASQREVGDGVASVVIHELFFVTYATNEDDEEETLLNEQEVGSGSSLAIICGKHPSTISQMLNLVKSHYESVHHMTQLFSCFPLLKWIPNSLDLFTLQEWLLLDIYDPRSELGRLIIESLNWESIDDNTSLFLDPSFHRSVALVLLEAVSSFTAAEYTVDKLRVWINEKFDFKGWCWKQVLTLKLLDKSGKSYVERMNLATDLSRDAGTLRRLLYGESTVSSNAEGDAWNLIEDNDEDGETDDFAAASVVVEPIVSPKDHPLTEYSNTEPIVAYVACQITNHLFHKSLGKWRPLLVLLENEHYEAAIKVLMGITPIYAENIDEAMTWSATDLPLDISPRDLRFFVKRLCKHGYVSNDRLAEIEKELVHLSFSSGTTQRIVSELHDLSRRCRHLHPVVIPYLVTGLSYWESVTASVFSWTSSVKTFGESAQLLSDFLRVQLSSTSHRTLLIKYWLEAIVSIPEWNYHPGYRHLVNTIVSQTFLLLGNSNSTVFDEALEICQILQNRYREMGQEMIRALEKSEKVDVVSFLPITPAGIFTKTDLGQVVHGCAEFSFLSLLIESQAEWPLFKALGHLLVVHSMEGVEKIKTKGRLANELYLHGIETSTPSNAVYYGHSTFRSLSQFKIYRWASYVLELPNDLPILVLYWQVLFILYFAKIGSKYYGYQLFLRKKSKTRRSKLKRDLRAKLRELSTFFNSLLSVEGEDSTYATLSKVYTAMDAWLDHNDPNEWLQNGTKSLPDYYCSAYLDTVLEGLEPLLQTDGLSRKLWYELLHSTSISSNDKLIPRVAVPSAPIIQEGSSVGIVLPRRRRIVKANARCIAPIRVKAWLEDLLEPNTNISSQSHNFLENLFQGSILLRAANLYSENLSQLVALDRELVESLQLMYTSVRKTKQVRKACSEGSACMRPALIRIDYDEWNWNQEMSQVLNTIYSQSDRCDIPTTEGEEEERQELCKQILLVRGITNQLLELKTFAEALEMKSLVHRKGIEWFHILLKADTMVSRIFPPVRELLWSSIRKLGECFVQDDSNETGALLRVVLADSERVPLLSVCFRPGHVPHKVVEYFCHVMSNTSLPIEDRLSLLRQFDFKLWLANNPTIKDRSVILSVIMAELTARFTIIDTTTTAEAAGLLAIHSSLIHQICLEHLKDHIRQLVPMLLGLFGSSDANEANMLRSYQGRGSRNSTTTPSPVQLDIWDSILQIPNDQWKKCSDSDLQFSVRLINEHVTAIRWQGHYDDGGSESYVLESWMQSGILKRVLGLVNQCLRSNDRNDVDSTLLAYTPFVTVLYQPASVSELSSVVLPWSDTQTELCVTSSFFIALSESLHTNNSSGLQSIWRFYVQALRPNATDSLLFSFYTTLVRLPWEKMPMSREIVAQMTEVVREKHHSPWAFNLVRDVVTRCDWKDSNRTSSFWHQVLQLLMLILLYHYSKDDTEDDDDIIPTNVVSFLQNNTLPWHLLEVKHIDEIGKLVLMDDEYGDFTRNFNERMTLVMSLFGNAIRTEVESFDNISNRCDNDTVSPTEVLVFVSKLDSALKFIYRVLEKQKKETTSIVLFMYQVLNKVLNVRRLCDDRVFLDLVSEVLRLIPVLVESDCSINDDDTQWALLKEQLVTGAADEIVVPSACWRVLCCFLRSDSIELISIVAIGKSVASVFKMSTLYELCIEHYIGKSLGSWSEVIERLLVPELSREDFITSCLDQSCALTLLALGIQQVRLTNDHVKFLSNTCDWVEKLHVKKEQSLLYLVSQVTDWITFSCDDIPNTFKVDILKRMSKVLVGFGKSNSQLSGIVLGALGLGEKSNQYSTEFQVACLAINLFLRMQARQSTPLRINHMIPSSKSKTTEKHLQAFEKLTSSSEFRKFRDTMEWILEFVTDDKNSLAEERQFFSQLFTRLYPQQQFWLTSTTTNN